MSYEFVVQRTCILFHLYHLYGHDWHLGDDNASQRVGHVKFSVAQLKLELISICRLKNAHLWLRHLNGALSLYSNLLWIGHTHLLELLINVSEITRGWTTAIVHLLLLGISSGRRLIS